jgi:signal transduction histidine kinase/Flp pilus assembly protein TadD
VKIFRLFILLSTLSIAYNHYAQKPEVIDSLWQKYRQSNNDSIKLKAANFLAFHYIFRSPKRADSILFNATAFAKENKLNFGLTELTNTRGIYYDVIGEKDSSKIYFKRALDYSRNYNFRNIEVMCINNLGMFCWNNGQFKEAIDYFYKALEFSQKHNPENEESQSIYLNNIGLIYQELSQYEKAITYHQRALAIRQKYDLTKDLAQSYNNLAICYKNLNELDKAEKYINLAIEFAEKSDQPKLFYQYHDNLGNILTLQKKYKEAEKAYLTALEVPEEYQNYLRNEFIIYSNLIDLYTNTKEFGKAKSAIKTCQNMMAKDSSLYNFSESFFINSAKTYYALQELEQADNFIKSYTTLKDSLFSTENVKALADVEAKLKTKEKEAELAETKANLLQKEIEVGQKNLLFYGSLSAIIILLVIGYLVIKSNRLKHTQLKKETELQKALTKIELKNKLEEQRLRISRDLHDNIGSQLTFVISGLQFLEYNKDAKVEDIKLKLKQLSQFTQQTIHELRDTIWAMNKEEIYLTDLIERLKKYINQSTVKEQINIHSPEQNSKTYNGFKFNAIQGIQLFRIVQEAINNAVKHSEASNIDIRISTNDDLLELEISDNGKGFEPQQIKQGNGLKNIKTRAKRLGAKLNIESKIDEGTTISLKVK